MDNALITIFALVLNLVLGGPRSLLEGSGISRLGRIPAKLLRDQEAKFSAPNKPIVLVAYVVAIALVLGVALNLILKNNLNFLEVALVASLLPVRTVIDRLSQMKQALVVGNIGLARQALEGTVWKHHVLLDENGVARAGIELMAVYFSEKILAPILWYLFLGIPGLLICKSVTLMKDTLPAAYAASSNSNKVLLGIPALFSWVAARLASILWVLAGLFVYASDIGKLLPKFAGEITRLPTLPYILFTTATVMGLSLGGPTSAYENMQWLGDGSPKPTHTELSKAIMLYALLLLLLFLLLGLFL